MSRKIMTIEDILNFYGPSKLIKKTNYPQLSEAATAAGSRTIWEPIYGKKVWSYLNLETNVFAIIPKEPWVQTGWRVMTARATSAKSGAVAESTDGGAIPDSPKLTFVELMAAPARVAHTFDLGDLAEFLSSVDDAVDLLPVYREEFGKEHAKCIQEQIIADADTALPSGAIESIDRVVSSQAEEAGCMSDGDVDIYGINRSAGTTYDAYVSENDNTDRDLSLSLIDTVYQNVLDNGGQPKVILTKSDTLMRWQQLLEAERRYMDTARVVPTFGGVRGLGPGVEAGFLVATYFGIPIIPSIDVFASDTIGSIYFLDTDFIKFAVAQPTSYVESSRGEGFLYRGYFRTKGMFSTMGQLRAYRFNTSGKLRDLK